MNKKNWIRVISAFLMTICMMISLMPATFFADKIEREIPEEAIYLSTPEDVLKLAEDCKVNTWSQDKTIVLSNDIDMTGYAFYGIPTFGGLLIGNNFTIKGLHMEAEGSVAGMFRYIQKTGIVEDLKVQGDIQPTGSGSIVGGIAGKNAGELRNCSFEGTVAGIEYIGGIVGINDVTGLIEDCRMQGMVYGNHFVGGIAGENHGVVRNTRNDAQVNTLSKQNSVALDDITLDSLANTENASTTTDIGGVAGANSGVIRGCTNYAAVGYQHMGYNIGGIVGTQNGYVVDCVNHGQIQGRKEIGGIVGHMEPNIVLKYDADSLQMLSSQMDSMEKSITKVENTLKSTGQSTDEQDSALEDEMNRLSDAMDALSGSYDKESGNVDKDRYDAAMNEFSDSFRDAYKESVNLQESTPSTMADVANQLGGIVSQMETMLDTLSNADENLGVSIEDISDKDTLEDTLGKIANCTNYGKVSGDLNVGGIAGILAEENDLDVYQDTEIIGEVSLNVTYETRAVVRGCKNTATVSVSKQNAGGISGSMITGVILESDNFGNIDALNADYVGGIAGDSSTIIRNCTSKAMLAGDTYVGGIAGKAKEVTDCYAFVEVAAATEKAGAVIGYTESLPDGEDDAIRGNIFFISGTSYGGIDGISYTGATDEVDMAAFLQLPDLDEAFQTVQIIFSEDGQADIVKTIGVGESLPLSEVPVRMVKEGEEYDWEFVPAVTSETLGMGELADIIYVSEDTLTNVLFDQVYEVSFDTKGSVISAAQRTESNRSILLAVGSFAKNTTLEMQDILAGEAQINGEAALVNYQVVLSNSGVEYLHFLLPEGAEADMVKLFVKDNTGNWGEREFVAEGSYIVFAFDSADTGFALVEDTSIKVMKAAVLAGGIFVLGVVLSLIVKSRKRKNSK